MAFNTTENSATNGSFLNTGENNAPVKIDNSVNNITNIQVNIQHQNQLPGDVNTNLLNHADATVQCMFDMIKKDINEGRVKSSLGKLKKIQDAEQYRISQELLIRIETVIAQCHVKIGENEVGSSIFSNTYAKNHSNPISIANKVFSLILEGEYETAFKFGIEHIEKNPQNITLVYNTILSAQFVSDVKSVDSIICDEISKDSSILTAKIFFLRAKDNEEWKELAISSYKLHKNNFDLRWQDAEARLDQVVKNINIKFYLTISKFNKQEAESVLSVLLERFRFIRDSELELVATENISLIHNILTALTFVEHADITKEIANDIIKSNTIDEGIHVHLAQLCSNIGLYEIIKDLQHGLPPDVFAYFKFSHMLNSLDYQGLSLIEDEDIKIYHESQKAIIHVVSFFSKKKINKTLSDSEIIKHSKNCSELYAKLVLCNLAFQSKHTESALTILSEVKSSYHEDKDKNCLYLLANTTLNANLFRDFIEITKDKIHLDSPSDWLNKLATAYANDYPIREDANLFFKNLDNKILQFPEYAYCAGVFYLKINDKDRAIKLLESSYFHFSDNFMIFALLANQYEKYGDEERLNKILAQVDLKKLKGRPEDLTGIISIFKDSPRLYEAFELAYMTVENNYANEKAVLNYIYAFFFSLKHFSPPKCETISCDCYVTTRNENDEVFCFLICDDGVSNIFKKSFSLTDKFVTRIFGLKVGDTFKIDKLGVEATWKIDSIEEKYTAAVKECIKDFNLKFPTSSYLCSIRTDDNFEQFKSILRQLDDREKAAVDAYIKSNFPLAMAAKLKGIAPIAFADMIRGYGHSVATCMGICAERESALSLIQENIQHGITLDSYTAFICGELDIFDALLDMFGEVFISTNCLFDIHSIADRFYPFEEHMVASYKDGKIATTIIAAEDSKKLYEHFMGIETKLKTYATPITIAIPNDISSFENLIIEKLSVSCLDDLYIAKSKGTILLSDDMYYRNTCYKLTEGLIKSVWLQPVLDAAVECKALSNEKYANAIVGLASLKHGHLFLSPSVLLNVFQNDSTPALSNLEIVASYIGKENADIRSQLLVSILFLNRIWVMPNDLKARGATEILLRNITRFPEYKKVLEIILKIGNSNMAEYVRCWMTGHFISL
ncbi:hypothetical protein DSECCO2_223820 [anaerobic digester metagenome]